MSTLEKYRRINCIYPLLRNKYEFIRDKNKYLQKKCLFYKEQYYSCLLIFMTQQLLNMSEIFMKLGGLSVIRGRSGGEETFYKSRIWTKAK